MRSNRIALPALLLALLAAAGCGPQPPEKRFGDICTRTHMLGLPDDKLAPTCLCMGALMSRSLKAEQFDRFLDGMARVESSGDKQAFFDMARRAEYAEPFGQAAAQCDPARSDTAPPEPPGAGVTPGAPDVPPLRSDEPGTAPPADPSAPAGVPAGRAEPRPPQGNPGAGGAVPGTGTGSAPPPAR